MDGVGRFKVGGSLFAIRAKAPVISVVIQGGHRAMPLGSVRAQPGAIRIRFCDQVPTEGCAEADARDFADRLQAVFAENYAEMSGRPPPERSSRRASSGARARFGETPAGGRSSEVQSPGI